MAKDKTSSEEMDALAEEAPASESYVAPPPTDEEKAAQQALDDAAQASADEAARQKARADAQEEFNKKAYEESIAGQELPPSVQEAQG